MSRRGSYYGGYQGSAVQRTASGSNAFSRQSLARSSSSSSSSGSSRSTSSSSSGGSGARSKPPSQRMYRPARASAVLQRKQSASSDAFAFAESVQTPPMPMYAADHTLTAAGTPQSQLPGTAPQSYPAPYAQAPFQQTYSPPHQQQQQQLLNRTMSSGSTGFGSMYGGFCNTNYANNLSRSSSSNNLAAQNSFYGNMGSFYGGFSGDAGAMLPSSRGADVIGYGNVDQTQFMNTSQYGQGFVASPEGEHVDDEGDLLGRTSSSGRILRRRVSFSGVPPSNDEGQRTVAQAPKRVGSRGPNWQRALDAETNAGDAAGQYQQQQQQQQQYPYQPMQRTMSSVNVNNINLPNQQPGIRGYGSMYGRPMNANGYYNNTSYNPYAGNAANYGGLYSQQQQQQQQQPPPQQQPAVPVAQNYGQPRYNLYGANNYATFTNGSPLMLMQQQRPMMPGFRF